MNINILARKFEIKIALGEGKPPVNFNEIKAKATQELRKHFEEMSNIVKKSEELRNVTFAISNDPLADFENKAKQGIESCQILVGEIFKIDNNKDNLSLEDMV